MAEDRDAEVDALDTIIGRLKPFDRENRDRLIRTVLTYFGYEQHSEVARTSASPSQSVEPHGPAHGHRPHGPAFSDDRSMSPKEFMAYKQPQTDVERVACLAFYLNHYRQVPYFKTLEISQLNTEAAQIKFSNAAYAVNNAVQTGYVAAGPKGTRQISAVGERFVQALPDREAARAVMAARQRRRRKGRTSNATSEDL